MVAVDHLTRAMSGATRYPSLGSPVRERDCDHGRAQAMYADRLGRRALLEELRVGDPGAAQVSPEAMRRMRCEEATRARSRSDQSPGGRGLLKELHCDFEAIRRVECSSSSTHHSVHAGLASYRASSASGPPSCASSMSTDLPNTWTRRVFTKFGSIAISRIITYAEPACDVMRRLGMVRRYPLRSPKPAEDL